MREAPVAPGRLRRLCDAHRFFFLGHGFQELVVGVGELLHSLLLELARDRRLFDTELGESAEDVVGALEVVVDADLRIAVVAIRVEGDGDDGELAVLPALRPFG